VQLEPTRTLVGFAKEGVHGVHLVECGARCNGVLVPDRFDAMGQSLLGALRLTSLRSMSVCVLVAPLDGAAELRDLMACLFGLGAARLRLLDAAVAVLAASGADAGSVLSVEHDGVCAACVAGGRRLPLPEWPRSPAGVAAAMAALRAAEAKEVEGDALAWLLHTHCYVRAVGIRRVLVSEEEREMSQVEVEIAREIARGGVGGAGGASVTRVRLASQRFLAFESLFEPAVGTTGTVRHASSGDATTTAPVGAVAALRLAIEHNDGRRWAELYQAIHVVGMGAAAAGLQQRLKAELRQLRAEPGMPRTVRPALAPPPPLELDLQPRFGSAAPKAKAARAFMWPLSAGELAAWAGAARWCGSNAADEPSCWAVAARFERGALSSTVQAMRHGGCGMEAWLLDPTKAKESLMLARASRLTLVAPT